MGKATRPKEAARRFTTNGSLDAHSNTPRAPGSDAGSDALQAALPAAQDVPQAPTPVVSDDNGDEPAPAEPERRGPMVLSVLGGLLLGFLLGLALRHLLF